MVYIYVLKLEYNKYYIGKTNNPKFRLEEHFKSYGSAWTHKYTPIKVIKTIPNCSDFDEDKYTLEYMSKYGIDNVRGGSFTELDLSSENRNVIERMLNGANDKCYNCGKSGHFINDCLVKTYDVIDECKQNEKVLLYDIIDKPWYNNKEAIILRKDEKTDKYLVRVIDYRMDYLVNKQNMKYIGTESNIPELKSMDFINKIFSFVSKFIEKKPPETLIETPIETPIEKPPKTLIETPIEKPIETLIKKPKKKNNCCYRCGRNSHWANNCYASTHINGRYLK